MKPSRGRGSGHARPRSRLPRRSDERVGRLGGLNKDVAKDWVLDAREKLNVSRAPLEGRRLIMAPASETAMLKTELFIAAQMRGDGGTALDNATLGKILGFDTYMAQNVNSVLSGADTSATAIVLDDACPVGATGAGGHDHWDRVG